MTPEEALNRANAAARLMDDPTLKEALDIIEREVMEAWMSAPVRDLEARESLWRFAVTARKFRDLLKGTMEAGKLARDQIDRKRTALERVANMVRR